MDFSARTMDDALQKVLARTIAVGLFSRLQWKGIPFRANDGNPTRLVKRAQGSYESIIAIEKLSIKIMPELSVLTAFVTDRTNHEIAKIRREQLPVITLQAKDVDFEMIDNLMFAKRVCGLLRQRAVYVEQADEQGWTAYPVTWTDYSLKPLFYPSHAWQEVPNHTYYAGLPATTRSTRKND